MNYKKFWGSLMCGILLIGIGILFYYNLFWPGILFLLGILAIMGGFGAAMWKGSESKRRGKPEELLTGGLVLLFIGLAIFIGFYWTIGLGVWLVGALVPGFIGVALLLAYAMTRKK